MANTIQIKRSSTAASVPTSGQLAVGELAVNLADKKLFTKDASNEVVELTTPVFVINSLTTADPAIGDFLPFADIGDSNNPKKATAESVVKAATNATGSAPIYACRAWVNFNGTSTVAIRASGNVSSITDNGTGEYTVNFTTAMPDADYSLAGTTSLDGSETGVKVICTNNRTGASGKTTTSCAIQVRYQTALGDQSVVDCVFFR
jgi:hypothetical protein